MPEERLELISAVVSYLEADRQLIHDHAIRLATLLVEEAERVYREAGAPFGDDVSGLNWWIFQQSLVNLV